MDRINGVNPPRRLLRNDFIDGYDSRTETGINSFDMIELTPIIDETKSVDTCSTTTNLSINNPTVGVLIWRQCQLAVIVSAYMVKIYVIFWCTWKLKTE